MNLFAKFESAHREALDNINHLLNEPSEMQGLVKWMVDTDANPYGYLPHGWAGALSSAESFSSLLDYIHHAVFDDGDITFVSVNGEPRITFQNQWDDGFRDRVLTEQELEMEKRAILGRVRSYEVAVLNIEPNEFGDTHDAWRVKDLKRCFSIDAARHGVAFANEHYMRYKFWTPEWEVECAGEIVRWKWLWTE